MCSKEGPPFFQEALAGATAVAGIEMYLLSSQRELSYLR